MDDMNSTLMEQFMQMHGLLVRQLHYAHMARGPMGTPFSGQGRVLKFLKLKPEFTQKELAELLGVRSQSLGELLAKLEKSGYVTRSPSETDRRVILVRLTEQGLRATEEGGQEGGDVFSCLSDEEQAQLSGLLDRVIVSLEERAGTMRGERGRRDPRDPRGRMRGFGGPHPF